MTPRSTTTTTTPTKDPKTASTPQLSESSQLLMAALAQLVNGGTTDSGLLTESDIIAALGGIDPQLSQSATYIEGTTPGSGRTGPVMSDQDFEGRKPRQNVLTIQDGLAKLYQLDSVGLASLQARLVNAGLLDKGKFSPGVVDSATINGFKELLYTSVRAKARGQSMADVLSSMEQAFAAAGGGDTGNRQRAATIELTDPNFLSLATDKIARTRLGRKAKPEDIQAVIKAVHEAQTQAQRAAIDNATTAANTKTGDAASTRVATIATPDPSAIAEQTLVGLHPAEAGAHDMGEAYLTMLNLIMGGQ